MSQQTSQEVMSEYREYLNRLPLPDNFSEMSKSQQREILKLREEQALKEFFGIDKETSQEGYFVKSLEALKKKAVMDLAKRNKEGVRGATEWVSKYLLHRQHFYTLRDSTEQLWKYEEGVYIPHAETYVKAFCASVFEQAYTDRLAKEVIDKIKARTYIDPNEFFLSEPKYRICVANGVLDLRTQELLDHTPEEFHFSKLPVTYDPEAYPDKIELFFDEVLANPEEDVPVMKELLGWLIIKEYKPEKTVMFYGAGRNGKGKTLELLRAFIGRDNYSSKSLHELDPHNNQYAASSLMNKLANFGGDVGAGVFKDTSVLRTLSGRDSIEAQRKYLDPVHFVNYAKLIFAVNKPPVVYDDHEGFWGRWVWLKFPYTFLSKEAYEARGGEDDAFLKVKDPDVVSKILSEQQLSGMLNWALEGFSRLQAQGDFSASKTTDEIKRAWTRKANSFEAFCMDCLEEDFDSFVTKAEMRRAYHLYCKEHGLKGVSNNNIKVTLSERFGSSDDMRPSMSSGDRPRVYSGVRFLDERKDHPDAPKFSFSSLGYEEELGEAYRVLNRINELSKDSLEGLVSFEALEDSLPSVDVAACLKQLNRVGDVFEPRPGFWKVMD